MKGQEIENLVSVREQLHGHKSMSLRKTLIDKTKIVCKNSQHEELQAQINEFFLVRKKRKNKSPQHLIKPTEEICTKSLCVCVLVCVNLQYKCTPLS